MIDRGILGPDDPIEILEGELVEKIPKNPPHRVATQLIQQLFSNLNANYHACCQDSITLITSEPEPDFAYIRGRLQDYIDRHPGPGDVRLVGEVADSTLNSDRVRKGRIYARDGIPEYWIVNLQELQVEVYTEPLQLFEPPKYQNRVDYTSGSIISLDLD